MSILSSVTNILEPITIPALGVPGDDCKPAQPDDCGDNKQSKPNNDHKDDYSNNGNKDDYSNHNGKDDYSQHDKDNHSKQAKNDDYSNNGNKDDYSNHNGKDDYSQHDKDDHSKQAKNDDYSNHGKDDYSKHDGGWQDAKNDNCQPQKDDCQPQKDYCQPQPSDDCGKADVNHNPGEALANCDFSHCDFGSQGVDHSGDMQGALASMSSGHALDYAIGQLGSADHFDVGHFDLPADTSHDMAHHA
jgi:hypothetical protein